MSFSKLDLFMNFQIIHEASFLWNFELRRGLKTPLFLIFQKKMHHASARKLLENNFSILSLTFRVSNSDVQRVSMISRVFAITRFLQKRSNKPRLLMIPMCLMIAGLLSTSFLLLLALSKREGETNKDMWTT